MNDKSRTSRASTSVTSGTRYLRHPQSQLTEQQVDALLANLRSHLSCRRVLVVDDNELNRKVLEVMLEDVGVLCLFAENGQEALDCLNRETVDAVLMDIQMPVMDGLEATRQIRANPSLQGLPVVAITAFASREDERSCREAGMHAFATKPVEPNVLYALLLRLLRLGDDQVSGQLQKVGAGNTVLTAHDSLPNASQALALLDREILLQLGERNPDRIRRLVEAFDMSARRSLDELRRAILNGDDEAVGHVGHKLKSSARWVGAMALSRMAEDLEELPAGQRLETCSQRLPAMQAHLEQVLEEMTACCHDA